MSYRDNLKQRISELQHEISTRQDKKEVLEKELQDLMLKDFEEEMREENHQRLLQEGC